MDRTATFRLLRGLLVVQGALCLVAVLGGLVLVGVDLQQRGEFLDGLYALVGGVCAGVAVVPLLLTVRSLMLVRAEPRAAAGWALASGVVAVGLCVPLGLLYNPFAVALVLPGVIGLVALDARRVVQ